MAFYGRFLACQYVLGWLSCSRLDSRLFGWWSRLPDRLRLVLPLGTRLGRSHKQPLNGSVHRSILGQSKFKTACNGLGLTAGLRAYGVDSSELHTTSALILRNIWGCGRCHEARARDGEVTPTRGSLFGSKAAVGPAPARGKPSNGAGFRRGPGPSLRAATQDGFAWMGSSEPCVARDYGVLRAPYGAPHGAYYSLVTVSSTQRAVRPEYGVRRALRVANDREPPTA